MAIATAVMAASFVFVLFVLWASNDFDGFGVSSAGLIGWILGSIGTAAVGIVLMGLVFLSDRTGHDAATFRISLNASHTKGCGESVLQGETERAKTSFKGDEQ
jgi:hypothetical protein